MSILVMAQTTYPYLDLTVLAEIRTHVIAANAAILFDNDLDQILWVNGEGAKLIGTSTVRSALENTISPNPAMMRQITAAVGKLSSYEEASAIMRVSKGFQSQLLSFTVRIIKLPHGEKAVLLLTENLHGRRHTEQDMARAAVDSLDGYGHASALLDRNGNIIAASEHFLALEVTDTELSALADEVSSEDDRLVKRFIETRNGKLPTGIARLSDNPATHLLIVADSGEDAVAGREALATSDAVIAAVIKTTPLKDDSTERPNGSSRKVTVESTRFKSKKPRPSVLVQDIEKTAPPHRTISDQDIEDVEKALRLDDSDLTEEELDHLDQAHSKGNDDFRFSVGSAPVRFVWEMDADNEFRIVSNELIQTVGPHAADIKGRAWNEVSKLLSIDNGAEISELLKKQDTWSGKTVLWPIDGTDLRVPIDLAGLPSYGRDRQFAGFNGFGIIRIGDTVVDPEATGMNLGGITEDDDSIKNTIGFLAGSEKNDNTGEKPSPQEPTHNKGENDNTVVDLDKRRATNVEKTLSTDDQETFEKIGDKLTTTPPFGKIKSKTDNDHREQHTKPNKFSIPEHNVDTSILARLPIPVLVYRENELLFSNKSFFELTGYDDLEMLANAGGVDALFGSTALVSQQSPAVIFHNNGEKLDAQAHLQRVPWDEHRAMLLTLRKTETSDENKEESKRPSIEPGAINPSKIKSQGVALPSIVPDIDKTTQFKGQQAEAFGGLGTQDLRSILDTATDGIVILSDEGIVRALNRSAEALFDIEPDQIVDRNFTKLLAIESHRSALDYVSSVAGTGVASILNDGREVIGRTSKGGLIPLLMTIGKLEKTNSCCAVMRDITQWKKTEEELVTAKSQAEQASAQKTEFLTKVSHEIRTPLNAIIGFSDIMIEERFGKIENDKYRGYLRDIHRSGNHVLELVNDLLDISKIEAGKMDLEFDACDLNTIVSETVALLQPSANIERVIIRTSLSTAVPKVVADARSLRQIVLNLVSNSIKYTNTGGQVIVSTVYEESGEVVLRVRDTGIGMNELELTEALKPFQQIGPSKNTSQKGTGLGLPLTKAMVEANRAQFHIESKPEEGTLVEIHFPSLRVLADR